MAKDQRSQLLWLGGLGAALVWLVFRERKALAAGVTMATGHIFGYKRGVPIPIELAPIGPNVFLRKDAAQAFVRMQADARKAGIALKPTTGWRSNEYQTELYELSKKTGPQAEVEKKRRGVTGVVAKPGFSNHQSGEAVDIASTADPKVWNWLQANAAKYGFKNTVKSEKWHWEYVT